jgi:hypothetical protein
MLTALTLALAFTPASKPLLVVTLPIVVIQIGRECRWDLSRLGDYSYGLYLWGFVVEQTVVNYIADPRTDWLVFSDCRAGVRDGSHFLAPRRKTRASLEAITPQKHFKARRRPISVISHPPLAQRADHLSVLGELYPRIHRRGRHFLSQTHCSFRSNIVKLTYNLYTWRQLMLAAGKAPRFNLPL